VKTETLIGYKLSTGSARLAQSMQWLNYRLDDGRAGFRFLVVARNFSPEYTPSLGPTQRLPQWVPGLFSHSMKLITHLHVIVMLRIHGVIPQLPHTSSLHDK
jgi:hypothetical protein